MAILNATQQELIGIIDRTTVPVNTPYLDMIKRNPSYYASSETVKFDEVADTGAFAGIVLQRSEMPLLSLDGGIRGTIVPDIIGSTFNISGEDSLLMQPGQVTISNGQVIDNRTAILQRYLAKQKAATLRTQNAFAGSVMVTGKATLPTSKKDIDWALTAATAKSVAGGAEFITMYLDAIKKFEDDNGMAPDNVLLDSAVFYKLMTDAKFMDAVKTYGGNMGNFMNAGGTLPNGLTINLGGTTISVLPTVYKVDGTKVDTAKMMHLSVSTCFTPVYAAINYLSDAGQSAWFTGDIFADKDIPQTKQTVQENYFTKSAFFPVLTSKNKIQRYTVTLT